MIFKVILLEVTIGKQGLVCHPEYIASFLCHKVCKSAAKSYFYLFNLVEEELMEQREERLSLLRLSRVVTDEGEAKWYGQRLCFSCGQGTGAMWFPA